MRRRKTQHKKVNKSTVMTMETFAFVTLTSILLLNYHVRSSTLSTEPRLIYRTNHLNETYVFLRPESDKTDFLNALNICRSYGSVVHIRDEKDNEFIQDLVEGHNVWLGSRLHFGSFFRKPGLVILDEKAEGSEYQNWKEGEPRCFTYCCGVQMARGRWGTYYCMNTAHVVCRLNEEVARTINGSSVDEAIDANAIYMNVTKRRQDVDGNPQPKELDIAVTNSTIQVLSILTKRVLKLESQVKELTEDLKLEREEKKQLREEISQVREAMKDMGEQFQTTIRSLEQLIERSLPETPIKTGK